MCVSLALRRVLLRPVAASRLSPGRRPGRGRGTFPCPPDGLGPGRRAGRGGICLLSWEWLYHCRLRCQSEHRKGPPGRRRPRRTQWWSGSSTQTDRAGQCGSSLTTGKSHREPVFGRRRGRNEGTGRPSRLLPLFLCRALVTVRLRPELGNDEFPPGTTREQDPAWSPWMGPVSRIGCSSHAPTPYLAETSLLSTGLSPPTKRRLFKKGVLIPGEFVAEPVGQGLRVSADRAREAVEFPR